MMVFFSHTSLYMRKLSGWFSAFHFLVVWFILLLVFFVIVLKDRRLSDFWVVREAFFFGG